jgi:hypothetical protein
VQCLRPGRAAGVEGGEAVTSPRRAAHFFLMMATIFLSLGVSNFGERSVWRAIDCAVTFWSGVAVAFYLTRYPNGRLKWRDFK